MKWELQDLWLEVEVHTHEVESYRLTYETNLGCSSGSNINSILMLTIVVYKGAYNAKEADSFL